MTPVETANMALEALAQTIWQEPLAYDFRVHTDLDTTIATYSHFYKVAGASDTDMLSFLEQGLGILWGDIFPADKPKQAAALFRLKLAGLIK